MSNMIILVKSQPASCISTGVALLLPHIGFVAALVVVVAGVGVGLARTIQNASTVPRIRNWSMANMIMEERRSRG